jgi:hypothetical protein
MTDATNSDGSEPNTAASATERCDTRSLGALPRPPQSAINSAIHRASAGSVCEVLAGLCRGLRFYVVPHGGHRSAPRVIAALAGFVHDRQSAADYEYNHNNNNE